MVGTSRWLRRVLAALATLSAVRAARAYDFEIRSLTIGQAEELRSIRFVGGSLLLATRRFTQTLSLSIWDIGRQSRIWRLYDPQPRRAPAVRLSLHAYLRLDHDFGAWTGGALERGGRTIDAIDLVPELEERSLQLDVLYAYLAAEGMAGGAADLYAGRQLAGDALDWFALDGALARVRTRFHVTAEAFGGLEVRESSPAGTGALEPDGTSGGECQEYVEGPSPGTGAWRAIQLDRPDRNNPFRSDLEVCPQRDQLMPTFGGAVELTGVPHLSARLSYRRAMSPSPDLIGPSDRLDVPDVGYYPDERGQAPAWGVNQERVALSARAPYDLSRGRGQVAAWAGVRYSLLHAVVDEATLGGRLRWKQDAVVPELSWVFPTFDGDSIFNVFSLQPFVDGRLTWERAPAGRPWRVHLAGWLRRFRTEDTGRVAPGEDEPTGALAGGGQGGLAWAAGADRSARVDLFDEAGYGGRRTGGYAQARWRASDRLVVSSRVSVVDYASQMRDVTGGWTAGVQLGGTYRFHPEIALSVIGEENESPNYDSQLSLYAVVDMAFRPEM